MFWKETLRLRTLPVITKIIISLFLVLTGIGYILGFLNIYMTYNLVDEKPGLSLKDISLTYYGARDKTTFEKSIDGSMKQYFSNDNEYKIVKDWVIDGASENTWDLEIKPIIDASCSTCHSAASAIGDVVTEEYSDIEPLLAQDSGKAWSRIISVSHTHILAITPLILLLVLLFSFTSYPSVLKNIVSVISFSVIFIDTGSWFLAKLSPVFSILVLIGGMSLGLTFGLLVVLPLYDLWIKKV
jgi:hypothetical protein